MEHIWKRINGTIQQHEGKPICIACGYTYDPEKNRNGWATPCKRGGDPICSNTQHKSE